MTLRFAGPESRIASGIIVGCSSLIWTRLAYKGHPELFASLAFVAILAGTVLVALGVDRTRVVGAAVGSFIGFCFMAVLGIVSGCNL